MSDQGPSKRPAPPGTPIPNQAGASVDPSLVSLVARGVLDAELAALVWVLVEGRIPLVVAAPADRLGAGGQLLAGIIGSIHPDEAVATLTGPLTAAGASSLVRGRRAGGVVQAGSLGDVRARLGGGAMPLNEDQLTFLGCVLVIGEGTMRTAADSESGVGSPAAVAGEHGTGGREAGAGTRGGGSKGRLRVTVAHYVRPLARDAHGHSQRLDPAVLAAWDPRLERYEHFAWGVLPEIASRLGRRTGDLEADLHHRRDDLAGLAKAGVTDLEEVRKLIAGYRVRWGDGHHGAAAGDHSAAGGAHGAEGGAHGPEGGAAGPHAEGPGHKPH